MTNTSLDCQMIANFILVTSLWLKFHNKAKILFRNVYRLQEVLNYLKGFILYKIYIYTILHLIEQNVDYNVTQTQRWTQRNEPAAVNVQYIKSATDWDGCFHLLAFICAKPVSQLCLQTKINIQITYQSKIQIQSYAEHIKKNVWKRCGIRYSIYFV